MGPKGARKGPGRPAWSPWAGRPGVLGPAGLALFGVQLISVFFSAKYASTLICVLPKPPTISAYKYPKAAVKEEAPQGRTAEEIAEIAEKSIQRYIRVRHKRKATPEASSSHGVAASWRTARDPSLAGDFVTMIDYASLSFMG